MYRQINHFEITSIKGCLSFIEEQVKIKEELNLQKIDLEMYMNLLDKVIDAKDTKEKVELLKPLIRTKWFYDSFATKESDEKLSIIIRDFLLNFDESNLNEFLYLYRNVFDGFIQRYNIQNAYNGISSERNLSAIKKYITEEIRVKIARTYMFLCVKISKTTDLKELLEMTSNFVKVVPFFEYICKSDFFSRKARRFLNKSLRKLSSRYKIKYLKCIMEIYSIESEYVDSIIYGNQSKYDWLTQIAYLFNAIRKNDYFDSREFDIETYENLFNTDSSSILPVFEDDYLHIMESSKGFLEDEENEDGYYDTQCYFDYFSDDFVVAAFPYKLNEDLLSELCEIATGNLTSGFSFVNIGDKEYTKWSYTDCENFNMDYFTAYSLFISILANSYKG